MDMDSYPPFDHLVLLQIFYGPRSIDHKGTILDEVRPEVPGAHQGGPRGPKGAQSLRQKPDEMKL